MTGASLLVLFSVLQHVHAATPRAVPTAKGERENGLGFHAVLEAGAQALPIAAPSGEVDGYAVLSPRLEVDGSREFAFILGTPLRLRLLDQPPLQQAQDYGGMLRREDWDEVSDFGQVLQLLRVGLPDNAFYLKAGAVYLYTLGDGHVVSRYNNQLLPDYHPAGAQLTARLGPAQVDLFASDVLAGRLFAGQLRLDLGELSSQEPGSEERYLALVSVGYDMGRGGGGSPAMGAAHVGAQTALLKENEVEIWAMLNGGLRLGQVALEGGGAFGAKVLAWGSDWSLEGRVEGRYQGGGFRFGLFGPSYELARFSGVGLTAPPLAAERLPQGLSGAGEVAFALGSVTRVDTAMLRLSLAGEYYAFGRVDGDLACELRLPGGETTGALRFILTGLLVDPRYAAELQVRQRVTPWLYVWGSGGVVHFAQAEGALVRGYTGGLGVGMDFER